MKANVYKELSNERTEKEVFAGKSIKENFTDFDLKNAIIIINGKIKDENYILREGDVVTLRLTPGAMGVAILGTLAGAAGIIIGIHSGNEAEKAKAAAENANKEIEKQKKMMNKPDIDNRPFLRGATNTAASGNSQPYIIGRNLFSPYTLSQPFYKIDGVDGKDQYTLTALECGFNKQVIKKIAIDDVTIKTFGNIETPQEDFYNLDASLFSEGGTIEISQDGGLFSAIPELNYKVVSKLVNDEIAKTEKVNAGKVSRATYTLDAHAKDVEVAIAFPYGLYGMDDNAERTEETVTITPQYSLDGGQTWRSFTFNQNGTYSNIFTRKEIEKELRYTAKTEFAKSDYNTLKANGQTAIYLRILSDAKADTNGANACYFLFYQSVCFDPEKSQSSLVSCKIVEDRERAFCTILGLKIKATKANEEKLKKNQRDNARSRAGMEKRYEKLEYRKS